MALSNADKQRAYRRRKAEERLRYHSVTISELKQEVAMLHPVTGNVTENAGNVTIIEELQKLKDEVTLLRALLYQRPSRARAVKILPSSSESMSLKEESSFPNGNESSNPNGSESSTAFAAFWTAYPRKIGKKAAQNKFKQAIKLTDLPTMLAAIERYKEHKPADIDFCHPTTWLHQGRWDDEFTESIERKTNGAGRQRELSPVDTLYAGAYDAVRELEERERQRNRY